MLVPAVGAPWCSNTTYWELIRSPMVGRLTWLLLGVIPLAPCSGDMLHSCNPTASPLRHQCPGGIECPACGRTNCLCPPAPPRLPELLPKLLGQLVEDNCDPCADDADGSSSGGGGDTGQHKPLLPLAAGDIEAGLALLFGLALASAGGVGGGALVVPILMLLDGWDAGATVPFAQLCGFATAVPRFLMVVGKPHPHYPQRPLIDFESFVVLTPSALIGNLVGIHLNVVAPSLLLLALMVILLTYITFRTCSRGRRMWREQRKAMVAQGRAAVALKRENSFTALLAPPPETRNRGGSLLGVIDAAGDTGIASDEETGHESVQGGKATLAVGVLFLIISLLSFIRGAPARPSPIKVEVCSVGYWLLDTGSLFTLVVFLCISGGAAVRRQRRREQQRSLTGSLGDVRWDTLGVLRYGGCAAIAGCASSFIGIGGGIVIGFLLHEMALLPQVASATVTLITLFTCGSNTLQFFLRGMMPLDYSLAFLGISLVAGWVGQEGIGRLVKCTRSSSLVVLALGAMVGLSDILLAYLGTRHVLDSLNATGRIDLAFHSPCEVAGTAGHRPF